MQALLHILQILLGISIFLLPGLMWSYISGPHLNGVQRTVHTTILAICIASIVGMSLTYFGIFTQMWFWALLLAASVVPAVHIRYMVFRKHSGNNIYQTIWSADIWYILGFSLIGTIWKISFLKSLTRLNDPYEYAFSFVGKQVPDLGFYTGMAVDRVGYTGLTVLERIQQWVFGSALAPQVFLMTFLFCGLIYLVALAYRGSRFFSLCTTFLMCIGPIELFYALTSIGGHSLAYVCALPLFLLFKNTYNRSIAILCVTLAYVVISVYYTATMMLILLSGGFFIATIIKGFIYHRFDKNKLTIFALICLIAASSIFTNTNRTAFSLGKLSDSSDVRNAVHSLYTSDSLEISETGEMFRAHNNTIYRDPSFLGLSAMRWQMLFFLCCGLTYIVYMLRNRRTLTSEHVDIGLSLIPVSIVALSFFYVNYPTRIFDYFAFFGLIAVFIPSKIYRFFFAGAAIYICITSLYIARDKGVFLRTNISEVEAAQSIKQRGLGVIFTDIVLANQIILQGQYAITGADDKDSIVYNLFFQRNVKKFMESVMSLHERDISYIAITQRMMDSYILMVNYPQKAMINEDMYERLLQKVYDNGSVRIYSTDISQS